MTSQCSSARYTVGICRALTESQARLVWEEAMGEQEQMLGPHLCRLMSCMELLKASSAA